MKKVFCLLVASVILLLNTDLLNAATCLGTNGRCIREIGQKEYVCKSSTYNPNCG